VQRQGRIYDIALPFFVYLDEDRSVSNDALRIRAMFNQSVAEIERRSEACLTSICKAGSLGS